MTDWTIILRSMRARLFSTVTTVVMVAVAVGLMLVLLMMKDSGRKAFERGTGDMHLLVSADSSPLASVLNGVFYANPPPRPISWAQYQQLARGLPLDYAVPVQFGDSYRGMPVLATTPEFFGKFKPYADTPWVLASGRFFERPFEVVVGSRAASQSGLRVGDSIFLTHGVPRSELAGDGPAPHVHTDFRYEVVGVLGPTGGSHDRALFTDLTSTWIIHAHDERKLADPAVQTTTEADLTDAHRKITGVYVRLASREGALGSGYMQTAFDRIRRRDSTLVSDPNLIVAQPRAEIDRLLGIVSNVDQVRVAMAAVVMAASAISIMLALYNSMEQRRRQIAILRVLGCSRPRIFGLVVTEATLLGLAGAAVGLVASLGGARIVAEIMKQRLGLHIDPALSPQTAYLVAAATVALAALAGVVPAVLAYRTPVARNLRPLA